MVGFDIGFAFLVGSALGWRSEGRRPELALAVAGLGIAPPGLAFLEAYPDWDWQYLLDPSQLPLGVPGVFVAAVCGAAWAGHKLGSQNVKVVVVSAAAMAVYGLLSIPRMIVLGDRTAWLAGEAEPLPLSFVLFGIPWFVWAVAVLAGCAWANERSRAQAKASG